MRTLRFLCGLTTLVVIASAGCGGLPAEKAYWDRTTERALFQDTNSSQTPADRMHTQRQVVDQDARALVDDIDFILLRERPSRLSRWHNR